jgi:hypothetical protein
VKNRTVQVLAAAPAFMVTTGTADYALVLLLHRRAEYYLPRLLKHDILARSRRRRRRWTVELAIILIYPAYLSQTKTN